ncbi:MAG: GNAT family N-acetyltransferase [Clostridium butyricum]|nr:GNAT family N-acetyltransferase [Clostridium butyricum]
MNIHTKRLLLVPLGPQYLMSTHKYASDFDNTRYMKSLPSPNISDTKDFLEMVQEEWKKANQQFYEYAILLDGEHIGAVSIYINEDNGEGNLGWIINKKYWRNGYAEEAAKGLLNFARQELRVRKFVAHCDSENTGSYRVMEILGMSLVSKTQGRRNKSSKEDREELTYSLEIE